MADRAGADQAPESRVTFSGSVHDTTGCSVGVGKEVEDAVVGIGVGGKDAGERFNVEGDDRRIGVLEGDNVDGEKVILSKCLRDISRPVIW